MKTSFIYSIALCVPAIMAATSQKAALDNSIDSLSKAIEKQCASTPAECAEDVTKLLAGLKSAEMDAAKMQTAMAGFVTDMKDMPQCVKAISDCVAQVQKSTAGASA